MFCAAVKLIVVEVFCAVIAVWLKAFQFTKLYEGVSGYRQWWILMNE